MINKKKTGLCLALAATLIASSALCGCQQSDSSTSAKFNSDVKDASKYTADENAQVYKTLDFSDEQEKEFAKKGFITAPDTLEIKTESGTVAWSQSAYDFIRNSSTPDSANPSLWRNTELNSLYGLFEVVDGVYQVRGYDVANVTFVKSDNGWIVFDCTTSSETAKAALELLESKFGKAHIAAVVVSHAHIDHYGGIGGLIDEKDVADSSLPLDEQIKSGKTLIIVPEGYEKAVMEFAEKKYVINDCDEYNNGCALFVDNVHKLDPIGAQFLSCILNLFKKFKLHIILATQPSFTQGKLFEEYFNCITLQKFSFQLIRADVENNLKNIFGLSEPINTELLDAFFPNLIVFNLFVQYTKSLDEKICTLPDLVYIYISFRKNVSENSYILEQFENIRINHPDAWNVCAQIYKKPLGISCELNPNTELLIAKRLIKQNDYGNLVPIHDIYTQCFQNHFHVSGNSDNELDALDRQINSYQVTGIAEETYEKIFHLRQTEQFYSVEYILNPIYSTDQQEKYRKLWGDEMFYLLYFEYSYAAVQNSRTTIGYDGFEIILKGINGTSSKRLNILQLEVIFELINSHFNVGEYSECEILFKQFNETYDRLVNIYGINPDKNSCLFYVLSNNYMLYIASEKNISESYTAADAQKNLLKEKYPYHYVDFLFRYGRTLFVRDWNTACIWIEDAMKEVQNFSNKQGLLVTFYAKFIDYINQKDGAYIGSMEQVIRECSKSFYSSSRHLNLLYCGLLYVKGYTSQADTLLLKDIAEARKIRTKMDAAYKQILAIYYLRHNDIDNAQEALRQSVSLFSFNSSYRRISQHNLEVLKNIDLNNMRYEVCTSPCLDPDTIYLDPRVY